MGWGVDRRGVGRGPAWGGAWTGVGWGVDRRGVDRRGVGVGRGPAWGGGVDRRGVGRVYIEISINQNHLLFCGFLVVDFLLIFSFDLEWG